MVGINLVICLTLEHGLDVGECMLNGKKKLNEMTVQEKGINMFHDDNEKTFYIGVMEDFRTGDICLFFLKYLRC